MKIVDRSAQSDNLLGRELLLPLIPLKEMVIFPYLAHPLYIGRRFSVDAVEAAVTKDRLVFLSAQKKQTDEVPDKFNIQGIGCIGEIVHIIKLEDGKLKVLVEGLRRARIIDFENSSNFYQVKVEPLPVEYKADLETESLRRGLVARLEEYVKLNSRQIPPESVIPLLNIENIDRLSDSVVALMNLTVKVKQDVLNVYDPVERSKMLLEILKKEIEMHKLERKIDDSVRKRMEDTQKKYFLNEKLKAINEELRKDGDGATDIGKLEKDFKDIVLTKEAKEKVDIEMNRLKAIPPLSAEYGVIKTYLEWIRDLPWGVFTQDNKDILKAQKILDESHYGLEKAKERIIEFIAVKQLVSKGKGPILCFVGPPGVGKTSLAKAISQSIGRNFVRVSLGGVRDEAEIRGHRRTYVGALPGRVIQSMKKAKSQNCVFLLDEIDKMSTDFRGDPSSALLEVLDPEQNCAFSDHYLEISFDLSDVFFITTANNEYNIPKPLHDRMEIIRLSGYTEFEKLQITKIFLFKKQLEENGLTEDLLSIPDDAILRIIREYSKEAGVRELERKIASVCRKVAKKYVENMKKFKKITVSDSNLEEYLGKPIFKYGEKEEKAESGVVTGLAWTEAGGDILTIEASIVEGSGKLILTGKLGEIMQESAQTAFSYARSKISEFGLPKDFYKSSDLHIHVPEGAVPKEGPSAGITIATALISALKGIPVRNDIAMTGEITLRGRVLPIGGVKEKVLSAHRSMIKEVMLPDSNRKDCDEIPEYVKKEMKFHFVKDMKQVLDIVLVSKITSAKIHAKKRKGAR